MVCTIIEGDKESGFHQLPGQQHMVRATFQSMFYLCEECAKLHFILYELYAALNILVSFIWLLLSMMLRSPFHNPSDFYQLYLLHFQNMS